jgi:hypothetical protein
MVAGVLLKGMMLVMTGLHGRLETANTEIKQMVADCTRLIYRMESPATFAGASHSPP